MEITKELIEQTKKDIITSVEDGRMRINSKRLLFKLLNEAINYTRSCTEFKCGDCDCKPRYENIGCDTLKDCKKEW